MVEKAANGIKGESPSSGIGKAAGFFDKILTPVSTYVAYVGAAALGGLPVFLMTMRIKVSSSKRMTPT